MTFETGFGSNAKVVKYRLAPDEGTTELYALTRRQIKALLSNTDYLGWMNRHSQLPEDITNKDQLEAWVSKLNLDLMTMIDLCSQLVDCTDQILDIVTDGMSGESDSALALQQAIQDMLVNNPDFITNIVNNSYTPLYQGNVTTADTRDILWAQCVQVVEYTHTAIMDLLEILEVQSNTIELTAFLNLIPGMKALLVVVPVDDAFELINHIVSTFQEQYEANWTETVPNGVKWKIACTLFCLCLDDKQITVPRINDAIYSLLDDYLTPNWDNMQEVIETVLGVNDNSEVVVYSMFFFLWGSAKLMGSFGIDNVNLIALKQVLALAVNDANDDWQLHDLCVDCEPNTGCETGVTFLDFKTGDRNFLPYLTNRALYDNAGSDQGWGRNTASPSRISIFRTVLPRPQTKIKFITLGNVPSITVFNYNAGALTNRGVDSVGVANGDGTFTYEVTLNAAITHDVMFECATSGTFTTERLLSACIDY